MVNYKAAICYLVNNNSKYVEDFNKSIHLLNENYLKYYQYVDIIIFHEKDFDLNIIPEELNYINIEISFKYNQDSLNIINAIPHFFPHPTHGNGPIAYGHPGFSRGYRHMCEFFFAHYFNHPIFHDYDYVMRLDTDSFILDKAENDLFCQLEHSNAIYGFIEPAVQIDNIKVINGLWDYVKTKYKVNSQEGMLFYTNFEILYIPYFKSDKSKEFIKFILKSSGIHLYRWGDHVLRYLMIETQSDLTKCQPITELHYQHGAIYDTRLKINKSTQITLKIHKIILNKYLELFSKLKNILKHLRII